MLLFLAAAMPTAARGASPAEYRAAVAAALAAVSAAEGADDAAQAQAVEQVTALLAANGSIANSGGQELTPTNPPLRAALASGDVGDVRTQLEALLAALDAAAAAPRRPQTRRPNWRWCSPVRSFSHPSPAR